MNVNSVSTYDDEIDLRAIFQTIWKARVVIFILTLAAALIAYAVSTWFLPKQYKALAYVTVSQPVVRYLTGQVGLSAIPPAPDIKALPELTRSTAILEQVTIDPRVASLLDPGDDSLADKTQVTAIGVSQLRFQVTDTNPERAATLASVWAEKAAEWIEFNYGLGALTTNIEDQIAQTQNVYAQTQSALETFLAQDPTPILQSKLLAQEDVYFCLERGKSAANAILSSLGGLEARLVQSDVPLSLSDALLLVSIQQDFDSLESCGSVPVALVGVPTSGAPGAVNMMGGGSSVIVQPASPLLFTDYDSSQGLEVIAGLRQSLQKRIEYNQNEQDALQNNVLKLQVEIEQWNYQRAELIRQRDQAVVINDQLTFQKAVMENVLQQSGRVAQVSAPAKTPRTASSPKPTVNTAVAGILGLALSALGALGVDWWKKVGRSA